MGLVAKHGRARAKDALRAAAGRYRQGDIEDLRAPTLVAALVEEARRALEARPPAGPRPVINGTGVLLHTNLGRAPLADAARDAVLRAAGFCALEYDLSTGSRGRRGEHVRSLLLALFAPGREEIDALATTNNAAALLLALDTVANGRPVAVSRGELVAIGGDFRVPSILAKSGASLLEVGTTNKTGPRDYEEALAAGAAAILKVRPSNYTIVGYTEEVALPQLAALAKRFSVPVVYDAGAGSPRHFAEPGLKDEPVPLEALDQGADLVCFSGDKTLGGPQAGLLLGRRELVLRAAANPLARALRPDKLVLAALAATLDLHLSGRAAEVPFHAMLGASLAELGRRAEALASGARATLTAEVVETTAVAGGGAGAESTLPSRGVALRWAVGSAEQLAAALRGRELPVVARIEKGAVILDLRTIAPSEDALVLEALVELGERALISPGP